MFSVALDIVNKPVFLPTLLSSHLITSVLWAQLLTDQVPNFPPGSLPLQLEQKRLKERPTTLFVNSRC